jgi:predicted DCC family thiol-disulfide oxidoreductase YuxK
MLVYIRLAGICGFGRRFFSDGTKTDMTNKISPQGIWFIYDGECPLCAQAALALRIKEDYGTLHLLDARANVDHPLMQKINAAAYDLDEGMVIVDGDRFYHGKDALRFMAKYGEAKGFFNVFTQLFYWSETIATITYPWLRGIRNALLRRKKISKIDNLQLQQEPIFKAVFGDDWEALPSIMHKHYANRPYSNDATVVEGTMDVTCSGMIRYLSPLFWLMGGIPPVTATNVPVTVNFTSDKNTAAFHFHRVFYFHHRKAYSFQSNMFSIGGDELIERMRFGLCWRLRCCWEDEKVKLKHQGYALQLFGCLIPLPLTLLLGAGNAEEVALSDNSFSMRVDITHPWWGNIYTYKGQFSVK